MANTHALFVSTKMSAWDVDAFNLTGVYSTADLDNGILVTLGDINKDSTSGVIQGYEYAVAPASANAAHVWVVESPEVGYDVEGQVYDDPRYFYNPAGKPMSLKWVNPLTDCIEIDAVNFSDSTLPTASDIGKYVAVAAGGKYAAADSDAPDSGAYFRIEGLHTVTIGSDEVDTVVLRCMSN